MWLRDRRFGLPVNSNNDTRFREEAMDQFTMNMLCYDEFRMWDDLLNNLWSYLKKTLDEETMKTLTEEQRAWIKEKEETVSERLFCIVKEAG